jgi:hypothetical protein
MYTVPPYPLSSGYPHILHFVGRQSYGSDRDFFHSIGWRLFKGMGWGSLLEKFQPRIAAE